MCMNLVQDPSEHIELERVWTNVLARVSGRWTLGERVGAALGNRAGERWANALGERVWANVLARVSGRWTLSECTREHTSRAHTGPSCEWIRAQRADIPF